MDDMAQCCRCNLWPSIPQGYKDILKKIEVKSEKDEFLKQNIVEDILESTTGRSGRVNEDVRSCKVVEQTRSFVKTGGGDGDVDDAPSAFVSLFEGEVTNILADDFLEK